jgi:hypothetical protein
MAPFGWSERQSLLAVRKAGALASNLPLSIAPWLLGSGKSGTP